MKKGLFLTSLMALAITLSACGSFGPPESCGEDLGGTADENLFSQYFESMALISQTTGVPGPSGGENGEQYAQGEPLAILVTSKADVALRVCIQYRGPGQIPFDQTQTLTGGENTFNIGAIDPGVYVVRVIVEDTLVKNFPFMVE